MTNPRKAKRVIRAVTEVEIKRLRRARAEAESARAEILHEGRIARRAWLAMRRDVNEGVQQLRAERQRLGLSLADIEERSGLRRSVLSRLENDKTTNPTLLTRQRYAAALGMSIHTELIGKS